MANKLEVLVIGTGRNYLDYLQKLATYHDLITITVLYKIPGYESLFSKFKVLPSLDDAESSFNICFLTPGTPLDIKADLLSQGIGEEKIFTELETFLMYIKKPSGMKNMGSMKFDRLSIIQDHVHLGTSSLDRSSLNDLEDYMLKNKDRSLIKWGHYCEVYERHFAKFRNTEVTV
ncbi:MAG: hypothetical protein LBR56_01420, partial [Sporomusaceae bacterium]|nr:hypothetical protein [Sporomusaceae bacterium]